MMMTKKHFTLIAQTLAACKPIIEPSDNFTYTELYVPKTYEQTYSEHTLDMWETIVKQFAERLKHENPQFDCAKFYQACNYTP